MTTTTTDTTPPAQSEPKLATTPWRPRTEIETNPIRIPRSAVERIAPHLDEHLASFFVLFHQYQKHHWLVEGPQFRDLHHFLEESYTEVHKDLDAIAERITALGAVPTCSPSEQARIAYIDHEPEGIFRAHDMLTRDRHCEGLISEQLRITVSLCAKEGDFGTETLLKHVLTRAEDRAHHLDHFLGEDSLSLQVHDD
jgi:starvation-inducible DNA-binding protein